MKIVILINGVPLDPKKAETFDFQSLLLRGVGVFETLRTYHGKLFLQGEHLRRLSASASIIGLLLPALFDQLGSFLNDALGRLWEGGRESEAKLRAVVMADQVIVSAEPLREKPHRYYEEGVGLSVYPGVRMHPQAKTLGSVICFESKQYAVKNGSYESILVTPEDQVLEGSYSNLFWVREGQLFTNSAGVLPGITRQTVIGLSGQCHFEEIHLAELKLCDEIFLTQTTTGILPVRSIEGERVGGDEAPGGFPGPVTRGLMKRFDGMTRSQKTE